MAAARRILFGLDRLPRTIAPDDTRLPGVIAGAQMLRMNTEPLPPDAMPVAVGGHTARVTAATEWLISQCGDYAPQRRKFIVAYFAFIAAHLAAHRTDLAERLKRYDGLYTPDDWTWSAMRPLPRAWLPTQERMLPVDIAFWDGVQPIALELAAHDTERQQALRAAGVAVVRIEPTKLGNDPDYLDNVLPDSFHRFWQGQMLPSSPFRRTIPDGIVRLPTA